MDNQLQKRIEVLEKQMASLNQSSTITYQVENAFKGRGFLTSASFISGQATLDGAGETFFEVSGVSTDMIALNNRGITSYIRANTTGGTLNELYLTTGDPGMEVNWVIIAPTDILFN